MSNSADDTSLFTIVHNPDQAASDMNHDLDIIKSWAHKWRMLSNPNPTKQAVESDFFKEENFSRSSTSSIQ